MMTPTIDDLGFSFCDSVGSPLLDFQFASVSDGDSGIAGKLLLKLTSIVLRTLSALSH